MILYSFDVGLATGICRYDTNTDEVSLWTVEMEKFRTFLESVVDYPDVVIIERMPKYNTPFSINALIHEVQDFFSDRDSKFASISPSTWKPIAKSRKWTCVKAKTSHEMDAYCLCKYFIEFYKERYET